jgi:hypothetical protein
LEVPSVESCRDAWLEQLVWLESLPDADLDLIAEVRDYVRDGVRLRFQDVPPPPRHYSNTYTYNQNKEVGRQRLREYEELGALKWLSDPPPPGGYPYVQPLHAVLKQGKKARICVDLSRNLNDVLVDEYFSYSSVTSAVQLAQQAVAATGDLGCYFVKLDISACFLSFPLHPEDLKYYVCKVGGDYVQFLRMVFGLKSAPRTASLLLDVVSAAMEDAGIAHERYLDDFWLVATTRERAWACAHKAAMLLSRFGLALSPTKVEGPAQVLEYLGIVVDSVSESVSISSARQTELLELLSVFAERRWSSLRALQSLIGKLSFAAAVLPGARPFLRRMIDCSRGGRRRLYLGAAFKADVGYWLKYLKSWNGRAAWRVDVSDPFVFGSDASCDGFAYGLEACPTERLCALSPHMRPGHVRVGVWSGVAGHAAAQARSAAIQWGECFPPLAAVVEYGALLEGSHVVFVVDNAADVHILNRMSSRDPGVCALVRGICHQSLVHNFSFSAVHRPGKINVLMDWASRPNLHMYTGSTSAFATHLLAERARAAAVPLEVCRCGVRCGVYPPLSIPSSFSMISSRCLKFGSLGNSASWSPGFGG